MATLQRISPQNNPLQSPGTTTCEEQLALSAILAELHYPAKLWPWIAASLASALGPDGLARRGWFECADYVTGSLMKTARTTVEAERRSVEARARKARRADREWRTTHGVTALVEAREGPTNPRTGQQGPTQICVRPILEAVADVRDRLRETLASEDQDPTEVRYREQRAQNTARRIARVVVNNRFRAKRLQIAKAEHNVSTRTRAKLVGTHARRAIEQARNPEEARRKMLFAAIASTETGDPTDQDIIATFAIVAAEAERRGLIPTCLTAMEPLDGTGVPVSTPAEGDQIRTPVFSTGVPSGIPAEEDNHRCAVPAGLADRRQWVAWKSKIRPDGSCAKVPINPATGYPADVTEPHTWGTLAEAQATAARLEFAGVGFVFTEVDPFVGIDLDGCRDPETGDLKPWAAAIVRRLDSYAEVSPSGTGVHIIVLGELPAGGRRRGKVEMYDSGRFFTFTGQQLAGVPATIEDRRQQLAELHRETFNRDRSDTPTHRTVAPAAPHTPVVTLSDEEIIEKLCAERDGKGARLWSGDTTAHNGKDRSASGADLALCSKLAFYTTDAEQIDRLFRRSGLMRPVWKNNASKREGTIATALQNRTGAYGDRSRRTAAASRATVRGRGRSAASGGEAR